jgi:imidazole glycerol-phosphate synthase subunit HisF
MRRVRVIPVLLMQDGGLVKTVKFKDPTYVGDPINAVKIFNEKEIDEIVILDIDATKQNRGPDMVKIREIAGEAFIPLAYGGGISTVQQVKELFYLGVEKVIFNYQAFKNPNILTESSKLVGSQSIVVSMDVKKNWLGKYKVMVKNGKEDTGIDPVTYAKNVTDAGAGEVFLNMIDRDGTYNGYDLDMIDAVSNAVKVPLIACGGASSLEDFRKAIEKGASAVAAGSFFVFQRAHRAVLISYPNQQELKEQVFNKI